MKSLGIVAALAVLALAVPANAQVCPYTIAFGSYGSGCAVAAFAPPTIDAAFDGTNACDVKLAYSVPPACCNVLLTMQVLVIGTQAVSVPQPGGCTLLASPNLVVALPPMTGDTVIVAALPPNPVFVGTTLYMQGVINRFTTIGFTNDLEFSNGLKMAFQ